MPDSDDIHLYTRRPLSHQKRVYCMYFQEFASKKKKSLSLEAFNKLWQERFSHVKIIFIKQSGGEHVIHSEVQLNTEVSTAFNYINQYFN